VRFLCGDAFDLDWSQFDHLYLYNPFEERQFAEGACIDDTQPTGPEAFRLAVEETERRLSLLRPGTRVATYHGFGGQVPEGLVRTFHGEAGTGVLEVWQKQ
jgi:hypothetical protein